MGKSHADLRARANQQATGHRYRAQGVFDGFRREHGRQSPAPAQGREEAQAAALTALAHAEESFHPDACVSGLWVGAGSGSQCRAQHLSESMPYRWAIGNGYPSAGTERFWTGYRYSSIREDNEQVGWLKEEPPRL
jgi:hypothetical protein